MIFGRGIPALIVLLGTAATAALTPAKRIGIHAVTPMLGATPIEALTRAVKTKFAPITGDNPAVSSNGGKLEAGVVLDALPVAEELRGRKAGPILNGDKAAALARGMATLADDLRHGDEGQAHREAGVLFGESSAQNGAAVDSVFIAQGFSVTLPTQFEPLSDALRSTVYTAADGVSTQIRKVENTLLPEDRSKAFAIEERLITIILEWYLDPRAVDGFHAPVLSVEDYCLGHASPNHFSFSLEVLDSLKDHPAELAEYVFHAAWSSLERERNKSDHRDRYLGLQRRIFGPENPLQQRLRKLIGKRAPEQVSLNLKGGQLDFRGNSFRDGLYDAFVRYYALHGGAIRTLDEDFLAIAANSLSRMPKSAVEKLKVWGAIDNNDADVIKHQPLYAPHRAELIALAEKVQRLILDYEENGFTAPEIKDLLNRMTPAAVLRSIERDTQISHQLIATLARRHSDFDTRVYQIHSVVEKIKDRVNGARNAWIIVIGQGLDDALAWTDAAVIVADQMQQNMISNRWDKLLKMGIWQICRKYQIPVPAQLARTWRR